MDQGEGLKPNPQPTRRSILKTIAAGATTALIGSRPESKSNIVPPKPKPPALLTPSETKMTSEQLRDYFLDFIFPKDRYHLEERAAELEKVEKWRQHFLNPSNPLNLLKRTAVGKITPDINPAFQTAARGFHHNFGLSVDNEWRQILAGLILVESSGNPQAISKDEKGNPIAYGLCQLKMKVAAEAARELKIPWNPDKLLDKDTNLQLGCYYLMKMIRLYPDCSLAIWSYHLGSGNMDAAIRQFVYDRAKDKTELDQAQAIFGTPFPPGTSIFTKKYQLTAAKLQNDQTVKQELTSRGATQDDTFNYLYKVVGATLALI